MSSPLYERLGGTEGITKIASDLIDIHLANPRIAPRYAKSDIAAVKNGAATFFISGTGGPDVYAGKDVLASIRVCCVDRLNPHWGPVITFTKNGESRSRESDTRRLRISWSCYSPFRENLCPALCSSRSQRLPYKSSNTATIP